MLRGINRQQIFEDAEDFQKFREILAEYKTVCGFKIFAYCLMGNHIHLLLKEGTETLEQVFKRVCGKFVYWYNTKYQRTGHLFQDRFKSEPVDTQEYLLAVIRYIHQNPIKAGMCKRVADYAYSSYAAYLGGNELVDTDDILKIWPFDEFAKMHETTVTANCLELSEKEIKRVTEEQAREMIRKVSGCESAMDFQNLDPKQQGKYLKRLRDNGVSIRQLSRLTGLPFGLIRKYG